ncbi:hypothetical protein A3E39_02565 [Candidatus Uhrbacteria bacterium RIFCSPHIGHO2_12_FULL_60_25]|uniref:Uncharacterized protein n=1 Tax=Candidatus Uhrbacteria bacterium RIFCSPHIGHO2_12_FULL_60_25 TaxID=1802399 RepID=A0A1F7UMW8_9BACT|nr:MAG: hypothetical protein A3E39_02565 [Candidatus Uhrbacteria bacterium RIFCSPHIGHO2_12_FULL_60_25]
MSLSDFLKAFIRQCTYALAFFVAIVLVAEFLTPASVTPFLDPVPFAVLAFALLSADAMRRTVKPNSWVRSVFGVLGLAIVLFVLWMRR